MPSSNIEKAFYSLASDIKKGMDTSKTEQSGSQGVNIDHGQKTKGDDTTTNNTCPQSYHSDRSLAGLY
jgi:hypothetical protein